MRLTDFALEMAAAYRSGYTLIFRDTETETQLGSDPAAYRPIGIRAWLAVPLVKDGRLLTIVGVHSATPRGWTEAEVQLLEDVAERTWAAVGRARAEDALRESEALLDRAFEAAEIGAWDYDLVGDVCHFDARAREMYGLPAGTLDHHPEGVAAVVHPDDVGPMFDAIRHASEVSNDGSYSIDYRIAKGDGQYRWLRAWGKAKFEGEGRNRRAVCIVGASRDVTLEIEAQGRLAAELATARPLQAVSTELISERQPDALS